MINIDKAEEMARQVACEVSAYPFQEEGAILKVASLHGLTADTVKRYLRLARSTQPSVTATPASIRDELEQRAKRTKESHLTNTHYIDVGPSDIVGVIGDYHAPFNHPMYVRFLQDTFAKHGVTKVLCIGDLVDNHAISRHVSEPDALDPERELEMGRVCVAELTTAFPEALMCNGNHDTIPKRQARDLGIPPAYIRNVREVWDVPETWVVAEEFILQDVYYFHGIGSSGMHAAYNRAKSMGMSVVQGHCHANGGVKFLTNPVRKWFGLDTGCGVDIKRYAFRYGKAFVNRPTLGCGVVYGAERAVFEPMDCGNVYNRGRA